MNKHVELSGPEIILGQKYRDTITGFEGVAVARTEWVHGCWRITLEATELKDNKPVEPFTFDVQRMILVTESEQLEFTDLRKKPTGGPPTRGTDPVRRTTPR